MKKFKVYSFIVLLALVSCSKDRNALINRAYHAVTARYNTYYNANEQLKTSESTLQKSTVDDFDQIIDLFQIGNEASAKEAGGSLDIAIQKASKAIDRHSMRFKVKKKGETKAEERELNPSIADCYYVLGKSYFYKREYGNAAQTFEYMAKEYGDKKIKYNAMLWLIRAYNASEKFDEAKQIIGILEDDTEFPKKKKALFHAIKGEYYIKIKDYKEAINQLTIATESKTKKKYKTRWYYVLGQLNMLQNNNIQAADNFRKVMEGTPSYDMQFSAHIKMARATSNEKDAEGFIRKLLKMSKEEKNKEYLDQIYFAVAEIYLSNHQNDKAEEYYLLSAKNSLNNKKQKGLAYLAVGDLNFKKPKYVAAAAYYDSAVAVLPVENHYYLSTKEKKESLEELVKQIQIIETQDSLIALAKMSESQRLKAIDKTISKLKEQEDREAEKKMLKEQADMQQGATQQSDQSGKWYFYNASLLNAGKSKFMTLWGNRPLEDNWRRKTKSAAAFGPDAEDNSNANDQKTDPKKTREYYLAAIPKSKEEIAAAQEKMGDAYFALGNLYKDRLEDLPSTIKTLEEMNTELPQNKNELKSYYILYRTNIALNKNDRAEYYKNLIFKNFPNSEYAAIIKNPNATKEEEEKTKLLNTEYEKLFAEYKRGNHAVVISTADQLNSANPKSALAPQISLLKAFSTGQTKGQEEFKSELKKIKDAYPGSDAAINADEILKRMNGEISVAPKEDTAVVVKEDLTFQLNTAEEHYFIIVVAEKENNVTALQKDISNYATKYYATDKLQMQAAIWDEKQKVIIVKSFFKYEKSIDFYSSFPEKVLSKYPNAGNNYFPISINNYSKLFKSKALEEYRAFFENNY